MNKKKLVRQCISCRKQLSREEFVRITRTYNLATGLDKVVINPTKHQFGRSAYVCKSDSCIRLALKGEKKGKKIEKMLKILLNPNRVPPKKNLKLSPYDF